MNEYLQNDFVKLFNGDCIEVMKEMINENMKVDKIITSPPYNIIRPNSNDRGYDVYKDGMTNDEYCEWMINIFDLYDKLLNPNGCVIMNLSYGTENTTIMNEVVYNIIKKTNFTLADIIVWKKQSATPNNVSSNKMTRICEYIYIYSRKNEFNTFTSNKKIISYRDTGQAIYENLFNFIEAPNNDYSSELNKATFSTKLVNELIERYVLNSDIVLDNFSGTGTTIYACTLKKIKAIGIELSEAQCEETKDRLKGILPNDRKIMNRGQMSLFDFLKE